MHRRQFTVTVDDKHMGSTEAVAETLKSHGFQVDRTIPEAGAIYGTATEDVASGLNQLEGVQEVRASRGVQLPGLSEDVPQ